LSSTNPELFGKALNANGGLAHVIISLVTNLLS